MSESKVGVPLKILGLPHPNHRFGTESNALISEHSMPMLEVEAIAVSPQCRTIVAPPYVWDSNDFNAWHTHYDAWEQIDIDLDDILVSDIAPLKDKWLVSTPDHLFSYVANDSPSVDFVDVGTPHTAQGRRKYFGLCSSDSVALILTTGRQYILYNGELLKFTHFLCDTHSRCAITEDYFYGIQEGNSRCIYEYDIEDLSNPPLDLPCVPHSSALTTMGSVQDITSTGSFIITLESSVVAEWGQNGHSWHDDGYKQDSDIKFRVCAYLGSQYIGSFVPRIGGVDLHPYRISANSDFIAISVAADEGGIILFHNGSIDEWRMLPEVPWTDVHTTAMRRIASNWPLVAADISARDRRSGALLLLSRPIDISGNRLMIQFSRRAHAREAVDRLNTQWIRDAIFRHTGLVLSPEILSPVDDLRWLR